MKPSKAGLPFLICLPLLLLLFMAGGMRLFTYLTEERDEAPPPLPARDHKRPRRPLPAATPGPPPKPVDVATQKALEQTAGGQVDAFSRSDFAGALQYSEEGFRTQWTPESFHSMIQARYLPLMNAKKKKFDKAEQRGAYIVLPLTVSDHSGTETKFLYILRSSGTGNGWRVIGCQPLMPVIASPKAAIPVTENATAAMPPAHRVD